MRRFFNALLAAQLLFAGDDLSFKAFTQKAMKNAMERSLLLFPQRPPGPETLICAIPLKELRAGSGKRIDPMAPLAGPITFDKISRPAPVQACPGR